MMYKSLLLMLEKIYALVFEYSKINKVSHWGSPFLKYYNGSNVCFSTVIPIQ